MRKSWYRPAAGAAIISLSLFAAADLLAEDRKYDPGASDSEIRIGQTMPYSGPVSAFSVIGKVQAAYFRMINDGGGINGRRINLISYDDAATPAKTVEQVRKLVERDEVLFTFQGVGNASNIAVQKYLNDRHIPQLFAGGRATRFEDPVNFPWTMGFAPNLRTEIRVYARFILDNHPNARIGLLYQNDESGKEYLAGLKDALGARAPAMLASEAPYDATDPTIDTQVVRLKAAAVDVLIDMAAPKFAAQAIRKTAELGWQPLHLLGVGSSSIDAVLVPAGVENAKGLISASSFKEAADPTWADDAGMKRWRAFMDSYYADGDRKSLFTVYGYSAAELLVRVLQQCGDDVSRDNIMRQAASLKDVKLDLLLPGLAINTSRTDYRVIKQFRMMHFTGERWEPFGPIVAD
ncbi:MULTISPECIES: ABC transporter substrate-binding protein [unclassified Bradyrhizobium]|uniref:ABC transporter substrate-binding protein n=1 Tax=unclassified Bradyrhizobium TaxID=2631580 RepID=UPI001BAAFB33|nr:MULTISPECIES: ABC transporter substrate-binding protein [unclassified Bradyrhizobium]MBR1204376.1 ABC transporter substrate-binding protein [Bradyrhizobium sp. AUGA SZCCT0124]MBR1309738.1 ABC transporter substrate-binding protein [Bradyrhizobium sp. AUGA SZCCT0051]MBR1339879.1 ABC transporter substrate-binding protein [Bradyrhizobium sp. AUGA SZCCT0105]MBR1354486.1 ABC transporter substrate-binding protein [Bradyrhizobium sp. AUGA SZCCT0045]